MERKLITVQRDMIHNVFHPLLDGARVYDSSCSPAARVWYIDRNGALT